MVAVDPPGDEGSAIKKQKSVLNSSSGNDSSILPKKKIIHRYETTTTMNKQMELLDKAKIKLMRSRSKDKEEKKVIQKISTQMAALKVKKSINANSKFATV